MSDIPAVIKVAGHNYFVESMTQELASALNCIGDCDRNRLIIRIADYLAPSKKAETLLHEVLHACTDAAGLMDEPGKTDEDVINPLARVLYSVLVDNPEFVQYIQSPT